MRAAFEKDRAEWKDKEEKFEKEMAEAKSKLTSRVVAVEERCKTLEKENASLKKELEEMSTKLTTMQVSSFVRKIMFYSKKLKNLLVVATLKIISHTVCCNSASLSFGSHNWWRLFSYMLRCA